MARKVAVLLVNYQNWPDTLDCLHSLPAAKDILKIVVDQKSSPAAAAKYKKLFPETKFIFLKDNVGFAAANNLGIRYAQKNKFPYVFLLNNDTQVDQHTINNLITFMEKNPRCGICSPVNYSAQTKNKIAFSGGAINLFTGQTPHRTDQPRQNRLTGFITGAAMFIRTKVFKTIGLMSEEYFLYYEDADFCQRLKKTAWEMWIVAQAKIWHKVSKTASQHPFIYYYCQRNRLEFFRKYGNFFQLLPFWFFFLKDFIPLILRGCLKPSKNHNRLNLLYSWQGLVDFFKHKTGKNYQLSD